MVIRLRRSAGLHEMARISQNVQELVKFTDRPGGPALSGLAALNLCLCLGRLGGMEQIAETSDRADHGRSGGIYFYLLAEPENVNVDRAVGDGTIYSPDVIQQLLAAEDHAR